ncbi:SDR family oxidoreductase [Francisella frigiditurris]|uniref:Short chain dehydrogenase family protein n=1 Tax=Francisella frigiditurris TaxID=1542390 RepID=A0A1J0KSA6_9GAMM|nr:SDR family oxidoreductase [Francisella frigiditurris]APC96617.1 short chain dehydrogenase family protein [Francisella frigiditurris]
MKKNILITGANGGIGAATALAASKNGYDICLHYHNNDNVVKQIHKEIINNGNNSILIKADISKESDIINMFQKINIEFGKLDALINNAGIIFPSSKLENFDAERLNKVFSVNAIGYILCCKHAIKLMSTKHGHNGGKIINISSAASRIGSPNEYIDYACTKGAIDTLTKGLALELADEKILVNCIRPGFIHTNIHALSGDPNRIEKLKDKIPLKRGGLPEEVASAVMWLLSEGANYTTGSFIDIAGGK